MAICATWPLVQYDHLCSMTTYAVVWPPMQYDHLCNMATYAIWPLMDRDFITGAHARTAPHRTARMQVNFVNVWPYCTGGHIAQVAILHRWPYCTGGHVDQVAAIVNMRIGDDGEDLPCAIWPLVQYGHRCNMANCAICPPLQIRPAV